MLLFKYQEGLEVVLASWLREGEYGIDSDGALLVVQLGHHGVLSGTCYPRSSSSSVRTPAIAVVDNLLERAGAG